MPGKEIEKTSLKIKDVVSFFLRNMWLTLGLLFFIGMFLYGASSSFEGSPATIPLALLDWLSASIIFFFIGSLIGSIVDLIVARNKSSFRLHAIAMVAFWVSCIVSAIMIGKGANPVVALLFPVIYGIFFSSYAFVTIFPPPLQYSSALKGIFNAVFSGVFFWWLVLEVQNKAHGHVLRKVLLAIIFIILLIGLYGCAASIASAG